MAASRVQQFLEQAGCRKRAAPAGGEQPPAAKQALLPVYLFLEHGKLEAREQLLWRLGDAKASPAAAARAFVGQYLQQPHLVERESQRLQNELQKLVEQHKDVQHAPAAPTLVRLELPRCPLWRPPCTPAYSHTQVRCSLPHLEALYADDPLWDLSAPRAACEAYIAAVCNELGLDWAAHTLIMRRMKDAIDAAARDHAAGKAQVVQAPTAPQAATPPSRMPRVVRPNEQQRAAMRQALLARQPFADGGSDVQHAPDSLLPSSAAAAVPEEQQAAEVKAEGGDAAVAAAASEPAEQPASAMEEEDAADVEAADAEAAEAEDDAGEAEDDDADDAEDDDAAAEAEDDGAEEADEAEEGGDDDEAASEGEGELAELQHLWQQEGGSSEEDMPDLPDEDD